MSEPPTERRRRPGWLTTVTLTALAVAGASAAVIGGTSVSDGPAVTDDEVALPDDDGLQDAGPQGEWTPPRVECERDGEAVDCVRWTRRLVSAGSTHDMNAWWVEATAEQVLARDRETVVALSRSSGQLLWQRELRAGGHAWHLDDEVVALQTSQATRALSVRDGNDRWSVDGTSLAMVGRRGSADTIHTHHVEEGRSVLTARAADGAVRWRHAFGEGDVEPRPRHPQVTEAGPLTFVVLAGPQQDMPLVAIDSDDGTERWRRVNSRALHAAGDTAVVLDLDRVVEEHENQVTISESFAALVGVDATDGTERWRYDLDGAHPQVDVVQGVVAVTDGDGITALDVATGETRWRSGEHEGERLVGSSRWWGPPWVSNDDSDVLLSFVDRGGLAIARHPTTGSLVWRTQLERPTSHLTRLGETVLARSGNATFVHLDSSTGDRRGTVTVEADGQATFVAEDVLVAPEAGWVVGIDLAGAQ